MFSAALAGFLTSMTLIVAIGAQNAFVLRQGIRREHVLPVVAVCATADALLITAGIAGLGALITNHPTVLTVTRYGGAAFLLVLAFVPRRKPVHATETGGVLDGVRFLLRDSLLGPIAAIVVALGFLGAGMSAGLPVYAFSEFDGSSRIAGLFYAALGAGAVVGSVAAMVVVRKVAPLRLAGASILAFVVPIWVLPFMPPWPVVTVALFVGMFFTPLINGPFFAVLTARTPAALRPKMMTAVVSINAFAAPLGFIVAGQVLENWTVQRLFMFVAVGMTLAAVSFAAVALRHGDAGAAAPASAPS